MAFLSWVGIEPPAVLPAIIARTAPEPVMREDIAIHPDRHQPGETPGMLGISANRAAASRQTRYDESHFRMEMAVRAHGAVVMNP
ncbi:MAG TPA: hypothetical protein VNP95_12800, partial [Thermomicrobiales bacterium]|nr:hypothetical protein [Thermomicrobiales bacterium]